MSRRSTHRRPRIAESWAVRYALRFIPDVVAFASLVALLAMVPVAVLSAP